MFKYCLCFTANNVSKVAPVSASQSRCIEPPCFNMLGSLWPPHQQLLFTIVSPENFLNQRWDHVYLLTEPHLQLKENIAVPLQYTQLLTDTLASDPTPSHARVTCAVFAQCAEPASHVTPWFAPERSLPQYPSQKKPFPAFL